MEVPSLVKDRVGEEEVTAVVTLGDDDVLCRTPTRAIVYSGEGLLSDESVAEYPLDVERLSLSTGRRKTTFTLTYVDGSREVTVPTGRANRVLEQLIDGVLRVDGVTAQDESVRGVYRFSELTLVVTTERILKHVGASVWDEDFEEYAFEDLTGLDFEEGSVATQFVFEVRGRPRRIKAPNDEAPAVRRTIERAIFDYHDVDSLAALNERLGEARGDERRPESSDPSSGVGNVDIDADVEVGSGLDPLVGGSGDAESESGAEPGPVAGSGTDSERSTATADGTPSDGRTNDGATEQASGANASTTAGAGSGTASDASSTDPGDAPTSVDARAEPKRRDDHNQDGTDDAFAASADGSDDRVRDGSATASRNPAEGSAGSRATDRDAGAPTGEDLEDLVAHLDRLTAAVQRQNELLRKQHGALRELLDERGD